MLLNELINHHFTQEPLESHFVFAPGVVANNLISDDKQLLARYNLIDSNGSLSYISKISNDFTKIEVVGSVNDTKQCLKNQLNFVIDLINQQPLACETLVAWLYLPELEILNELSKRESLPIKNQLNLQKLKLKQYNHQIVNYDRIKFEVFFSPAKTILISGLPGTGKSSTIKGRIDTLISNGVKRDNICVINKTNKHQIDIILKQPIKYIFVDNIEVFSSFDLLEILKKANSWHSVLIFTSNPLYNSDTLFKMSSHLLIFNLTSAYRFNHYILDYALPIIHKLKPNINLQKAYYSSYSISKMRKLINYIPNALTIQQFFKFNYQYLNKYFAKHNKVLIIVENNKQKNELYQALTTYTDLTVSFDINSCADIRIGAVNQLIGHEDDNVIVYLSSQNLYQYAIALTVATKTELIIDASPIETSELYQSFCLLKEHILLERRLKNDFKTFK